MHRRLARTCRKDVVRDLSTGCREPRELDVDRHQRVLHERVPAMCGTDQVLSSSVALQALVARLAQDEDLPVPSRFAMSPRSATTASSVEQHLHVLMNTDPGVFLERYGGRMSTVELDQFDRVAGAWSATPHSCLSWFLEMTSSLMLVVTYWRNERRQVRPGQAECCHCHDMSWQWQHVHAAMWLLSLIMRAVQQYDYLCGTQAYIKYDSLLQVHMIVFAQCTVFFLVQMPV